MPTLFNLGKKKGVFMVPSGGTKSPTPTPPSFSNTKSLAFDGVDDYVDISTTATLSGKAIVSISVWIKPDNLTGSNERIFDENTSTSGYTRFGLERDTDKIQMKWRDSANDPSGSAGTLTTGSVLTAGVWTHILAIYDSSSNEQKIYIDGSLSTSSSVSISALGTSRTYGINIGRSPYYLNYFQSAIDELAMWDVALGSTEVTELYTNGPIDLNTDTGNYTSSSDLQVWYRMGDKVTSFPTIPDQVGSNDGTATNMDIGDIVSDVP